MKSTIISVDILPLSLTRVESYGDGPRVIIGNASAHGPIVSTVSVTGASISQISQVKRPLVYSTSRSITTECLTAMLVHKLGTAKQHMILGFETGVLIILSADTGELVRAAQFPCTSPVTTISYDNWNEILIATTAAGTIYRYDKISNMLNADRQSLLVFSPYSLPDAGSEIYLCSFVPDLDRSRFLILYSSGRIDLFSTDLDTFLQPDTNRSVAIPVLGTTGATGIITAAQLSQGLQTLFIGTYDGAIISVSLEKLMSTEVQKNYGEPVSVITPLENDLCVGTLNGRIIFGDSTIFKNANCSIRCVEPLNPRLAEVLVGTDRWSLVLITLEGGTVVVPPGSK